MALTLTQAELSAAIRLGDSARRKTPRRRAYWPITIEAISQRHLGTTAYEDRAGGDRQ